MYSKSANFQKTEENFEDKVIYINRVAKVVKGGRRFSFTALVVTGDQQGRVGLGHGKANEVPEAIKKATKNARKNLVTVPVAEGATVPHEVLGEFGAGQVLIKPAKEGTGIIASATVRAMLEACGYKNVRTKTLRSRNPQNVTKAVLSGLQELRSFEEIAKTRGKELAEIL